MFVLNRVHCPQLQIRKHGKRAGAPLQHINSNIMLFVRQRCSFNQHFSVDYYFWQRWINCILFSFKVKQSDYAMTKISKQQPQITCMISTWEMYYTIIINIFSGDKLLQMFTGLKTRQETLMLVGYPSTSKIR